MPKRHEASQVPEASRVQAARLFGLASRAAHATDRTPSEWKRFLDNNLNELFKYIEANVRTDELHRIMIYSGLAAAHEALKQRDFWPGYSEGITRVAFLLIGDYPDHRRRRPGRKTDSHYDLRQLRSVHYIQDSNQRMRTLFAAKRVGLPRLDADPRRVLSEFRKQAGPNAPYSAFFDWYRQRYPEDYSKLF